MSCCPACEACLASAALAFLPRFAKLSKGVRQICWPTTSRSFFARRSTTRAKQLGQPGQRSVGSNGVGCDRLCNFDEWLRRALFPGTWSCRICLLDQKTVRLEPGERIQMSRTVDNRLICSDRKANKHQRRFTSCWRPEAKQKRTLRRNGS